MEYSNFGVALTACALRLQDALNPACGLNKSYHDIEAINGEVYGKSVISGIMLRQILTNTIAKINSDKLTTASTNRPIN